jgi:CRP-like cAMP-binding protein
VHQQRHSPRLHPRGAEYCPTLRGLIPGDPRRTSKGLAADRVAEVVRGLQFAARRLPLVQAGDDGHSWNVRTLLESTGTPFSVAQYEKRGVIFRQGDACDRVLHIEQGRVRLAGTTSAGKEATCGLLETGAFLGEDALGGQAVRRLTATAITAAEVLVVEQAQMIRLLHTQPAVLDRFIAHILARSIRLEADLTDQLLNCCEHRLARTLLVLAGCDERRLRRRPLPDVSQAVIAEMVGTSRSRVNTLMGKFRKLGFIEAETGVFLVNPSLLQVVNDSHRGIAEPRHSYRDGR